MLIAEFYENQEVFITGGSGFIGKALIEKLLRSCPGVGKIFVLLRGKKGKNADERLNGILQEKLFKRLHQEQPSAWRKVVAIEGDCSELGLGISVADLQRIQNVNIIYHSAASVRFDDELRDAILLNTRGTHELLRIAETLPQLRVFLHVSTTYCNPSQQVVEEEIYAPIADWRTTIKLAETYSNETLNIFNLKYGKYQPNTYVFTKSLSEQVINDFKNKLPVLIFRPSIVVSSLLEPVPGWMDNFNGPLGLLVACGIGIMRSNYGDPDIVSDFVPVDIVVRAMIIACYRRCNADRLKQKPQASLQAIEDDPNNDYNNGNNDNNSNNDNNTNIANNRNNNENHNNDGNNDDKLEVINCAVGNLSPITTGEVIEIGKKYIKENPFEQTLWVPGGGITRCRIWHFIKFITLHILMAILVDSALRLTSKKPFLLKLQRRIFVANIKLHFFVTTFWDFKNKNFIALDSAVPQSENDTFAFMQYVNVDFVKFIQNGIRGAKEFLLNESPDSSQGARVRVRIFEALNYFAQLVCVLLLTRFVVRSAYAYFV